MATVRQKATLTFSGDLHLEEVEMRALDALVGYGDDAFLTVFGDSLGKAYMRDHVAGLKSFFSAVRRDILPALRDIDQARKDLEEAHRQRVSKAHKEEPL